jgi:TPR repeat protein
MKHINDSTTRAFETSTRPFLSTGQSNLQGDADSQVNLGNMYYKGQGVEQDCKQAKYHYELAAEQGLADAQYKLGYLYYSGHGVAGPARTTQRQNTITN